MVLKQFGQQYRTPGCSACGRITYEVNLRAAKFVQVKPQLGQWRMVPRPSFAAVLEIMAGAAHESKQLSTCAASRSEQLARQRQLTP